MELSGKKQGLPTPIVLLLTAALLMGAGLRLYNVDWDDGQLIHPDERWIVIVEGTLRLPENPADLLDARESTLNPYHRTPSDVPPDGEVRRFAYGNFPLYLLHFLAEWLERLGKSAGIESLEDITAYGRINLLGRVLSALFDTGTLLLVFLLGRRLYGRWAGLLATWLLAFTVLHIQLSHFYAFDVVMAFFVVAAILADVEVASKGGRGSRAASLLAGLATGLAVASKFSAMPLLLPLALAHAAGPIRRLYPARGDEAREDAPRADWMPDWKGLLIALGAALIIYFVTSPYVLLDRKVFLDSIRFEGQMVRGESDLPYTRQYRGTLPYIYQVEQQLKWGMGWFFGAVGFAGLGLVTWRTLRLRAKMGELIALSWCIPYFLLTGSFMVKYMRYLVTLAPFLAIFGAGMLVSLLTRSRREGSRAWPVAAALIALTLLNTALWAAAFVQIYSRPLTRVAASEWIYRNVPPGTTITAEDWDDRLPFDMDVDGVKRSPSEYNVIKMALQEADTPLKLEIIIPALEQADYVVISSNRFYGWLPRMRDRYPITNRYYDLLFAEKLGFELAAAFTSYPNLGPLQIVDDDADESFTVYDHPKVLIYRKTKSLSIDEYYTLFEESLQEASFSESGTAEEKEKKSLMLDVPVDELPVVDDYHWNAPANRNGLLAALVWWVVVQAVGLATLPVALALFRTLPDRGHLFARPLGLLLVGYLVWMPAGLHLLPNRASTALLAVALLAVASTVVLRYRWADAREFFSKNYRQVLLGEAVFTLAFAAFLLLRFLNPDLWHPWNGGEKRLEIGFLNAIVKSANMPPYDPFFADGYMNYYYYGLFLVGLMCKLTGIQPTVAFNLAVPTFAAFATTGLFSLGYNLSARRYGRAWGRLVGALAVFFVLLVGNIQGALQLVRVLGEVGGSSFQSAIPGLQASVRAVVGIHRVLGGAHVPTYNYWDPTRVIQNTINEFPLFSYIFADLHPHMINIPLTLMLASGAYSFFLRVRGRDMSRRLLYTLLPHWLALAFMLGALGVVNTWDMPTYLGLAGAAYFLARYQSRPARPKRLLRLLLETVTFTAVTFAAAYLLYLPFFSHYWAADVGVGLVRDKTSPRDFLAIWGLFLFIIGSYLLSMLARPETDLGIARTLALFIRRWNVAPRLMHLHAALTRPTAWHDFGVWLVMAVAVATAGLFLLGYTVPALLLPLLSIATLLLIRPDMDGGTSFATLVIFTGLLVAFGVEFVFLRDWLGGGENYRMNTLFKFYIQVWVLLGLGTAFALPVMWEKAGYWRLSFSVGWQLVVGLLVAACLVYTMLGTKSRVEDRFPDKAEVPPFGTLDGLAYMTTGTFEWPPGNRIQMKYDYEAIRWLQANVTGTPVIAEAKLGYYREDGMRVSAYTGLPMPVGGLHQNEQRYAGMVGQRDGVFAEFWGTTDLQRTKTLVEMLRISYIYVGQLERAQYPPASIDRFEALRAEGYITPVYSNDKTIIYKVVGR